MRENGLGVRASASVARIRAIDDSLAAFLPVGANQHNRKPKKSSEILTIFCMDRVWYHERRRRLQPSQAMD